MAASATTELSEHAQELQQFREKMEEKSDQELYDLLRQGFKLLKRHLLSMAAALGVAESRGMQLEGDQTFFKLLRQINAGKVLVDVVIRFAGRPVTMASVMAKPVEKQEELLDMTDDEVEKLVKKPKAKPAQPANRNGSHASRLAALTAEAALKQCLEIIDACDEPAVCMEGLMHRLVGRLARKSA